MNLHDADPTRMTDEALPVSAPERPILSAHHGRLFRKYLLLILSLVTIVLVVSGAISIYFSYQEHRSALASLQHEKAVGAASRIEQYVRQITQQLAYAALPQLDAGDVELRRIEFLKLLRQAPEVTDIAQIDASGHELLAVSRLGMDVVGSGKDRSREPGFRNATRAQPWFGPVYFRRETEPYMTVAIRSTGDAGAVTIADVNLKFIWDVVSRIRIGDKGKAYVVDRSGFLVADPDIGLVLRKTNLSGLAHVKAAAQMHGPDEPAMESVDLAGTAVLTSVAPIVPLEWKVFIEQPVAEVFAKLNASILRTVLMLLAGLVGSALAALALARSMVRPIRTLDEGARRIGAGDLNQQIVVNTGDELQGLADQFNRMTLQLRESYAGLEHKVEVRTGELKKALEQQTATAEILKVIGSSPTHVQPVLDAVVQRSRLLCRAEYSGVWLADGGSLRRVARDTADVPAEPDLDVTLLPMTAQSVAGRAFIERRCIHVEDIVPLLDSEYPDVRDVQHRSGFRTVLALPMVREGTAVGAIALRRNRVEPFSPAEIGLVQTFADQAVIAIENVRLFNETKEALQRQTAIAEILRVISGSVSDAMPVFEMILDSCQRLFSSERGGIYLVGDDDLLYLAAFRGDSREIVERMHPMPIGDTASGLALRERRVLFFPSMMAPDVPPSLRQAAGLIGDASLAIAPMLWDDRGVGTITVVRDVGLEFTDKELGLLKTFADQAVIAIQNARQFGEIRDKSLQLERADKHKSDFLANMSHELRTPLNAVIGFSEVLLERIFGELNEKQDDYLKDIHSSGRHLLNLINDILDLSKVEAGRMELDVQTFDAASVLSNAITLVRERAQRHEIRLVLEVDPCVGEFRADERKFKQILLNLLSNAVKFTPDGGSITTRARVVDTAVEVAVCDTGIGIAKEDQQAVFEEFRQVGRDYTTKHEGTGLGLALTKRFVELHGGSIRVDSEPGMGSTFTFILPSQP